jgi:hypothetical protein
MAEKSSVANPLPFDSTVSESKGIVAIAKQRLKVCFAKRFHSCGVDEIYNLTC